MIWRRDMPAGGETLVGDLAGNLAFSYSGRLTALDPDGTTRWELTHEALVDIKALFGSCLAMHPDGSVVAGAQKPDGSCLLLGISPQGTEVWRAPLMGCCTDLAATSTLKGDVVVASYSHLARIDPRGQELWSTELPALEAPSFYRSMLVRVAPDGSVFAAGVVENGRLEPYFLTVSRMNSAGQRLWTTRWSVATEGINFYGSHAMVVDALGAVYLCGFTYPVGGGTNRAFLTRFEADGAEAWTLQERLPSNWTSVAVDDTGGIYVAGALASGQEPRGNVMRITKYSQGTLPPPFRRGDASADGAVNLSDAVLTLNHLFRSGPAPECADAADADDSGKLDLADAVYLLNHLFTGGPEPPAPYGECGADLTADDLGCLRVLSCAP